MRIDGVDSRPPYPDTIPAKAAYVSALRSLATHFEGPKWASERPYKTFREALQATRARAIKRARAAGREFSLSEHDIECIYCAQEGLCAISGLSFDLAPHDTSARRPFAPSIDRVDSRQGYVLGNVRLVLTIVNIGMADWGEDTFRRMCRAVAKRPA